jgi:TrmH family RNA methyltransferase
MITSTKNPRIQHIRKLQRSSRTRQKDGLFVAEGVRLVGEAYRSGRLPTLVLYTQDLSVRGEELIACLASKGVETIQVAPHVMQSASDTQTPQGILALLPTKPPEKMEAPGFLVIPDGIRDPGNMGTILRTALAAGVEGVILPPGTTDPYAPKVLRAGMGAHFKLPIHTKDWDEIQDWVSRFKLNVFLADSEGGQAYHETEFQSPLVLVIGGEAAGASIEAKNMASCRVHIPMSNAVESLNSGIAAGILMFEVYRQKISPLENQRQTKRS